MNQQFYCNKQIFLLSVLDLLALWMKANTCFKLVQFVACVSYSKDFMPILKWVTLNLRLRAKTVCL